MCKLDEINMIEQFGKFDIIGLTETHFGPNSQLFLENYFIYQLNKKKLLELVNTVVV